MRWLGLRYYPDPESVDREVEKAIDRDRILEFTIDHLCGKLVKES